MKFNNTQRHKLLSLLADARDKAKAENATPIGLEWDFLCEKFNCSKAEMERLAMKPFVSEYVDYYTYKGNGLFITNEGMAALTECEYLKERNKSRFELVKNWIQIIIPVAALVASVYTIISSGVKEKHLKREIEKLQFEQQSLERRLP